MEHRRESRLNIGKNVMLRVLTLMGSPDIGNTMTARVVNVSGSGIRLELPLPVPCGAEVEIADKHTLILGEILRCDLRSKAYMVAVRVSQTTAARS
jgi:hypothetical protein